MQELYLLYIDKILRNNMKKIDPSKKYQLDLNNEEYESFFCNSKEFL